MDETKVIMHSLTGSIGEDANNACSGVTGRVVVLSLLLAAIFGYIIPIIDVKLSNTFLGAAHLSPGAIAVLLVLLLALNPLLRLVNSRAIFARNEILTVYITCLFSCLVPGHGSENFFLTNIIGPFYRATPENKWLNFLGPYLKPWFTPALSNGAYTSDSAGYRLVQDWYTGISIDHVFIPWGAWLVPLVAWGALILASYIMLACLSVMLRAQWAEREALSFPLLRLPLEMTEVSTGNEVNNWITPFFRNPLMWIGFGIAAFIQLMNGLHLYFPDVPPVPLSINTGPLFTEAPWNQIGGAPIIIWPLVVGITYLLTSEVSFSLWFFYWFIKIQLIVAYIFGFPATALPNAIGGTGGKAFQAYQVIGCYLAYVLLVLWTGREHFAHIARRALGRASQSEGEKQEALSYPVAFWGFIICLAFLIAWSMAAGMNLLVALTMWGAYLIIAIGLTRVVCEGGLLFVQQGWTPLGTIAQLTGSGPGTLLPPSSIVPGAVLQNAMMIDMRAFLLPSFVQSFKLAHDRKISPRPLLALIATVVLITLCMSFWMNIKLGYQQGGLQLNSWYAKDGAQLPGQIASSLIKGARDQSWAYAGWMGIGSLLTFGLMLARSRFVGFPFHPVGLLMCLSYPMSTLWSSIFVGWLCKILISRFGGSDSYRKTTPLFLGLVLGDVVMMLFWLAIDGWQGRVGHQLMPG